MLRNWFNLRRRKISRSHRAHVHVTAKPRAAAHRVEAAQSKCSILNMIRSLHRVQLRMIHAGCAQGDLRWPQS